MHAHTSRHLLNNSLRLSLQLHTRLHKLEQERREQNANKMEAYTQQVALEQLKDENKDKARLAQKLAELEVSSIPPPPHTLLRPLFVQHATLHKCALISCSWLGVQLPLVKEPTGPSLGALMERMVSKMRQKLSKRILFARILSER